VAKGVSVVAQFSEGIEPVSAEGAKVELLPGQVLFQPLTEIAPNETVTLKIKARASRGGNHVFRAEVKCPEPETKLVCEGTTRYYGADAVVKRPTPGGVPTPAAGGSETPLLGVRRAGTIQR